MTEMILFSRAVTRACKRAFVIGDMPYMSYQPSVEGAVINAGRFMAEASCDGVKLEGGIAMADRVRAIVNAGIPVMGHLGLTPQSASMQGGFKVQAKSATRPRACWTTRWPWKTRASSILLELVPDQVCGLITERAKVPIISLGSGPNAHGQLLIFHDMFGLYPSFTPKMAKKYGDAGAGHRRRPETIRGRGHDQGLPRAGTLLRHQGRGVRRAAAAGGTRARLKLRLG